MTNPAIDTTGTQRTARRKVSPWIAYPCLGIGVGLLGAATIGEILTHYPVLLHLMGVPPMGADGRDRGIPWTTWFQSFLFITPQLLNSDLAGRLMDKLPTFGGRP